MHWQPPATLWKDEVLLFPTSLENAHQAFLTSKGWSASEDAPTSGTIGGQSSEEAIQHLVHRFFNSAARMQYVCLDPFHEATEIREMVFDQMAEGSVQVVDLGAGNGAGTLALLALLCELRRAGEIPKLPLNISISAIDFSADALAFYAELLDLVTPELRSTGIEVTITQHLSDLTILGELTDSLESCIELANKSEINRYMCIASALSGVKLDGMGDMAESFRVTAAILGSRKRNSSWLWVEPSAPKGWFKSLVDSIALTFKRVKNRILYSRGTLVLETEGELTEDLVVRKFHWRQPKSKKTISSHVVVLGFRNQ